MPCATVVMVSDIALAVVVHGATATPTACSDSVSSRACAARRSAALIRPKCSRRAVRIRPSST
ncbi:hypothetical protein BE04_32055 [Sorangium cellulosum]|uniref:Uncharacterized protein n=3 Tax=Sorangium cellulosum TaxID=56 RepID=A0A150PMN2_SORCE|nr:hypothetical protein SCE1572_44620 [Sorangium cellulosum So0157-2]KYF56890.1 hypothetical protein BE04_32055 [Sorangium cellulosum]KYG09670.1 hypothetical protein BE21_16535 [Sorangium cellulosum]